MSANLYWRQVKPVKGESLDISGPSSFIESLNNAFGPLPLQLCVQDIPTLKGMAAMYKYNPNPYKQVIEAVEKFHSIEIWAEY